MRVLGLGMEEVPTSISQSSFIGSSWWHEIAHKAPRIRERVTRETSESPLICEALNHTYLIGTITKVMEETVM